MLEHISITCDRSIKIYWEWKSEKIEGVWIYYKKNGSSVGDGTEFVNGIIMQDSHRMSGKAERLLVDELGLYTFTFVPKMRNGEAGQKLVMEDVMLGAVKRVVWRIQRHKEGWVITFPELKEKLLKGSAYLSVHLQENSIPFPLEYEIVPNTKIVLCGNYDIDKVRLMFREPYDRVYKAERRWV